MGFKRVVVTLPIADRRTSHDFYRHGLGLNPIGEPAEDGLPEPLQFEIHHGLRLMLVPTGGFSWVTGDNEVASPGMSECILNVEAATDAEVDGIVRRAARGGAKVIKRTVEAGLGLYWGLFRSGRPHLGGYMHMTDEQ